MKLSFMDNWGTGKKISFFMLTSNAGIGVIALIMAIIAVAVPTPKHGCPECETSCTANWDEVESGMKLTGTYSMIVPAFWIASAIFGTVTMIKCSGAAGCCVRFLQWFITLAAIGVGFALSAVILFISAITKSFCDTVVENCDTIWGQNPPSGCSLGDPKVAEWCGDMESKLCNTYSSAVIGASFLGIIMSILGVLVLFSICCAGSNKAKDVQVSGGPVPEAFGKV
eukprot:GDKH01006135.1.p1 GENE.GDKH01006135.1~~GDKH01006135.1.p1  ORF type:complete len:226 (+),score=29.37 GDKH01006135.1:121-798(+)